MPGLLDRLDAWGADFEGERRLFPWAAVLGAIFFVVVRVTVAFATGARSGFLPTLAELAAGAFAFAAFWGGAALLAARGLPRTFLVGVLGHLVGYVVAAVNVANAARAGYETSLPLLTLVEFTILGFLAGGLVDAGLAARRKLRKDARPRPGA